MLLLLTACTLDLSSLFSSGDEPEITAVLGVATAEDDPRVVEVDDNGEIIWEFHVGSLFGATWADFDPKPHLMDVQPVFGGNILMSIYRVGLVEINRRGDIVWRLDDPDASHDVDRLPDGNTLYTRTWAKQGENVIVEVDPAGNIVWSWTGVDSFGKDPRFDGYLDEGGAWMHVNAVQRLDDAKTSICIRNFNEIVLVDPDGAVAREITYQSPTRSTGPETTGMLHGQLPHGAEWLPGGDGLLVALRGPDRAVQVKGGAKLDEFRAPGVRGITDVDRLPDGGLMVVSHNLVQRFDNDGDLLWSWDDPSGAPEVAGDRGRAVFHTITPTDADGAPLDND